MSSAVVIPARKHSAIASVVPAATVSADSTAALGRQQPGQEAFEVEVVGEAAEHRHRQVGVGVDEARHDDRAAGVDRAVGVDRAGGRADVT